MTAGRKLGWLLLAGVGFGVLMAVVKGQDTGVRDALGNTSAPWVVLPFLAGSRFGRVWQGAAVGVAVTLASLIGFYAAEAAVLDLGAHPWWVDLRLTLGSGRLYEEWGIFAGVLFGALGARSFRLGAAAVGAAFLCEPAIVWAATRAGYWGGAGALQYAWLWVAEIALGLAAIALVLRRSQARAT
jgi:hypothetical protein